VKRALDLFSKAGGATKGLQRAGYHVTGVDIEPQPRYCGDEFIQTDALTFPLKGYDFIWASPPCQGYSELGPKLGPRLIQPMLVRLKRSGTQWALENVMGAATEMPGATLLCGSMFHLDVKHSMWTYQLQRHRLVMTSFPVTQLECDHHKPVVGVYGAHARNRSAIFNGRKTSDPWDHRAVASAAMGIDWMNLEELSEAIPPAYSQYIAGFVK
jgi:DNA (cytosine-5)-methyltransferase 1